VKTNPARKPDFGNAELHPTAGATVVGARKFLVAYNVYLNTPDVDIAKKIGKAVRFSNGGLRYVKGMGVSVRGLAQVSMNLTDTDQTPIARVYEYVKREAARYGVMPLSSEIVGLIPKKALEDAAEWFLQIENFDSSLILENRLAGVMSGKMAVGGLRAGVEPFIEQLAAPTAAPGGGSASAATGAMAAALGCMVAGMSRGKKAYLQHEAKLSDAIARLAELRENFKAAIDADAASFNEVMSAFKKLKDHPEAQAEVDAALKGATEIPLKVAELAGETRRLLDSLRPLTNPKMASDLTVGIGLAKAAADGALANVEINLADISDVAFVSRIRERVAAVRNGLLFASA
jgi:formiminotetrahydrofolate cyclodeaminase